MTPDHPDALTAAEAIAYTQDLLEAHGRHGWTVRVNDRLTSTYGRCWSGRRLIEISGPLMRANPAGRTEETCRHEVAHAIAGARAGHGPKWKAVCERVGADPVRCYSQDVTRPAWYGVCAACGQTASQRTHRHRDTVYTHKADACPAYDPDKPFTHRELRWSRHDPNDKESIMSSKGRYTIVMTDRDGGNVTDTRARKDDAIKVARRAQDSDLVVAWAVLTPSGETVERWSATADRARTARTGDGQAAAVAPTGHPRRDRIPAGATHHVCDGCGVDLPVTKFPTTRDRSRLTECRGCRDARRATTRKG